jgi:hypothetical protein
MKRKRLLLLSGTTVVVIALVVAARVFVLMDDSALTPGVTKANYDRISVGMTTVEVVRIFGEAPFFVQNAVPSNGHAPWAKWRADNGSLAMIRFAADGCVIQTEWYDSNEPFWGRLRRWVHLK